MPFDVPFRLGPFIVDDVGGLSPGAPDMFPSFSVCWRDRVLHLRLAHAPEPGAAQGKLGVRVVLGRVPSTAGADVASAARRREEAFAILRALPSVLPAGWEISLLADHSVQLALETDLEMPTKATALVTAVTLLLLELTPYLDVLDAGGIAAVPRAAASGTGMANAWPG
jgi:hypothetical protein